MRAGIGESLYAMDSPWLRVGGADGQLRANRAGKPYLDERTSRWLARTYEAWLGRAGSIFGEPLPHAPAPALLVAGDAPDHEPPTAGASGNGRTGADTDNTAGADVAGGPPEPEGAPPNEPTDGDDHRDESNATNGTHVGAAVREAIGTAHAAGVSAKTVKRLPILLAERPPDSVVMLEDLDDALATELARSVRQARAAGWSAETLSAMVERALGSEPPRSAMQRRTAFIEQLAASAQAVRAGSPEAA